VGEWGALVVVVVYTWMCVCVYVYTCTRATHPSPRATNTLALALRRCYLSTSDLSMEWKTCPTINTMRGYTSTWIRCAVVGLSKYVYGVACGCVRAVRRLVGSRRNASASGGGKWGSGAAWVVLVAVVGGVGVAVVGGVGVAV
jgi:hypothetical protein